MKSVSMAGASVSLTRSSISRNIGRGTASGSTATVSGVVGTGFLGTLTLSRSSVDRNVLTVIATGGNSDANDTVSGFFSSLTSSTISRNSVTAVTKTDGHTATAQGGGVAGTAGGTTIANATIALNHVTA